MEQLPVLPPRPMGSFPTFASTIQSTSIPHIHQIGTSRFHPNSTHQAIDTLNRAITPIERVEALKLILRTCSHNNVDRHDYEMTLGADKALCLKLGYVVVTSSCLTEEMGLIFQCLVQIYQCSSEQRKRSFRSIGATELIPLLIQIFSSSILSTDSNPNKEPVLTSLVKVLRVYAKLDSAKSILIRYHDGIWLSSVLKYCAMTVDPMDSIVPPLTLELLGLMKDLTFRTSSSQKEFLLRLQNHAFERILALFCREQKQQANPRLQEWFTAVVWNLVLDRTVCSQLMQDEESRNFPIVRTLLGMLLTKVVVTGEMATVHNKVRRNATSSIGNIAAHEDSRQVLLSKAQDERDNLGIIPVLMNLVRSDPDSIVRRRAMRTIRCLASCGELEAQEHTKREDINAFLVETISRNVSHDDENDRDMQIQACQTVSILVDCANSYDWLSLEKALLERVESTTDDKLIQAACACLAGYISKNKSKRFNYCFSEMFWTRIETSVSSGSGAHPVIASFLLTLSRVEKERNDSSEETETTQVPSALTRTQVVNILTALISLSKANKEEARNDALAAVVVLVESDTNRRPLAEHEGLLASLVNLCLQRPDGDESKASAKQVIIDLVPEI